MNRKPDMVTRIVARRLTNSTNGNPRYRIAFADGTMATTQSDAAFCYGITNRDMRGDVKVWLSRAGRVEHVEPLKPDDPATE